MDNAFQWTVSYSVKVAAMDAQHRRLFDTIRELYNAMRAGKSKEVLGDVLRRLVEYTVKHFAEEEDLMKKTGYPLLAAHQSEHRAFTKKVVAFQKDFDAGSSTVSLELMTFLQNWLTGHIQAVDQKYGEHLNSKGVR